MRLHDYGVYFGIKTSIFYGCNSQRYNKENLEELSKLSDEIEIRLNEVFEFREYFDTEAVFYIFIRRNGSPIISRPHNEPFIKLYLDDGESALDLDLDQLFSENESFWYLDKANRRLVVRLLHDITSRFDCKIKITKKNLRKLPGRIIPKPRKVCNSKLKSYLISSVDSRSDICLNKIQTFNMDSNLTDFQKKLLFRLANKFNRLKNKNTISQLKEFILRI